MAYLAQHRVRINGKVYLPGEILPDDDNLGRLARLGYVSLVPEEVAVAARAEYRRKVEEYDPSDHNVDEVLTFVTEHRDMAAILADRERASEGRKTLLERLDVIAAEEAETAQPEPEPEDEAPAPSTDSGYDPSGATVPEVVAYVESNPTELEAVIEAERGGRDRTSLIARLEALQPTGE